MIISFVQRAPGAMPTAGIRRDLTRMHALVRRRRWGQSPRALTVVTVPPAESRRLKRRYLKRDRAADVLTFRYNGAAEMILSPAIIRKNARAAGEPYPRALRRAVAHGFVHLSGHHHEASSPAAKRFWRLETDVLQHLGIAER